MTQIQSNLDTSMEELAKVLKKLDEISTQQDGFQAQFLNSRVDNTVVTNSVADEISLQAKQLDQLRGMIADVRAYVTEIADRLYEQELITDDLAQYSRANCLILHGCKDLPAQEATEQDFENYVLDKLNSKIKLPKALESNDIDICHVLPSTKGKNPIIIKFVRRSIRNQIFARKSNLKADENNTEKLSITEALTKRRLRLVEEAKRVFGFENVWTFKGRVYCKFQGRRNALKDFIDIQKIRFPGKAAAGNFYKYSY